LDVGSSKAVRQAVVDGHAYGEACGGYEYEQYGVDAEEGCCYNEGGASQRQDCSSCDGYEENACKPVICKKGSCVGEQLRSRDVKDFHKPNRNYCRDCCY